MRFGTASLTEFVRLVLQSRERGKHPGAEDCVFCLGTGWTVPLPPPPHPRDWPESRMYREMWDTIMSSAPAFESGDGDVDTGAPPARPPESSGPAFRSDG